MSPYEEDELRAFGLLDETDVHYTKQWVFSKKYLSPHLSFQWIIDTNGVASLTLILDDKTTLKEIRDQWPAVRKERGRVIQLFGKKPSEYLLPYLCELIDSSYVSDHSLKEAEREINKEVEREISVEPIFTHPSPRKLAMDINFDLLVFIIRASKLNTIEARIALNLFQTVLTQFSFPAEEIDDFIRESFTSLGDGECPFDIKDYPIGEERMKKRLDYRLEQKTDLNKGPACIEARNRLLFIHRFFLQLGDWQASETLLQKDYEATHKAYKSRLDARKRELLESLTTD